MLRFLVCISMLFFVSHPTFGVNSEYCNIVVTKESRPAKKGKLFNRIQQTILAKKVQKFVDKIYGQQCDIVVFRNGDELDVTITRITTEKVYFKPCDEEDSAIRHFRVEEIFMIKYANGERFIFETNNLVQIVHTERDTKGGFGLGILMGAFLGLLGIIIISATFKGDRKRNALSGAFISVTVVSFFLIAAILSLI